MNAIQFFANKNCVETADPVNIDHKPVWADLFEVQMQLVDIGNGKSMWCGSLQSVHDGQKRYFKSWSELVAHLQGILTPPAQLEVLQALLPGKEVTYFVQKP
jgi:hypothetical protein